MADEAVPLFFRCPISMETMQDPVTVSTGVTYERKNIHKWLFTYKKKTCPATMQRLDDTLDLLTPNHTLRRLIDSWRELAAASRLSSSSAPPTPSRCSDVCARLAAVDSAPFKVSSLRKIRAEVAADEEAQLELTSSGGVEVLRRVVLQILADDGNDRDFAAFQACEEALGVLYLLPLSDEASVRLLSTPECLRAMTVLLQRGGAEARLHAVTVLQRVTTGAGGDDFWGDDRRDNVELIKSLLELLSDEAATRAGACALDLLLDVLQGGSKKSRVRAVELGAAGLLVELLPEASRHCCERMLLMLKLLCECPEGRVAFAEHGLGIAAVSKKILRVSELATKLGVKVLWLVCSFLPAEKVLDEMVAVGAVKKLLALLHIDGRSSTKEKAMKMIKQHAGVWRNYPCFPCTEFKCYLKLMHA